MTSRLWFYNHVKRHWYNLLWRWSSGSWYPKLCAIDRRQYDNLVEWSRRAFEDNP